MAFNLRKYESQAAASVAMGAMGLICAIAAGYLVLDRFKPDRFSVTYSSRSLFMLALGVALLGAVGAAAIGFGMGFNSAGQKRNTRTRLSWIGFFLSAGAMTLALIVAVFFFFTRDPLPI